jgi:U6 snRNA-associated Sm-like protein LSm6
MFIGVLVCLDGYMNIALEDAREYTRGALKHTYGDVFIRGNNGRQQMNYMIYLSF